MTKPYRILNLINDISSCAYYRNVQPVIHCRDELAKHNIELTNALSLSDEEGKLFDAYVWSRIPDPELFPFIYNLRCKGATLIWDLDDELWNIPEWNPACKYFNVPKQNFLAIYLALASKIVASTENLADSIVKRYGQPRSKIVVLENLMSECDYSPFRNKNRSHSDTPFKIIWSGGHSHEKDVEPIKNIYEYYKDKDNVEIIMFGYNPPDFLPYLPKNLLHVPHCNRKHYEGVLSLLSPHVAVIPLVDCQFNICKSAIKYYEMTLAGIPSIVSNVSPYKDVVTHEEDGFIIQNDDEWTYYCDMFMNDESAWESVTWNAMKNVIENYSWDVPNKRNRAWVEFFKSIPDLK